MILLVCYWCPVWGGQPRFTILQEKSQADAKRTGVSQGAKPHGLGSELNVLQGGGRTCGRIDVLITQHGGQSQHPGRRDPGPEQ